MKMRNLNVKRFFNENLSNFNRYSAFTLAEVLITLGIIGIVASMTIPSLISNYQKTQYITGLKKAYSEFNQALAQMANDNGCPGDLKCTHLFNVTNITLLGDALTKQLKVVKNCGDYAVTNIKGCFPGSVSRDYTKSGAIGDTANDNYRFVTADGFSYKIYIENDDDACGKVSGIGNMTQLCGDMVVDVNGADKGPNTFGRDVYFFYITNAKGPNIVPFGSHDDNWTPWREGGCGSPDIPDANPSKHDGIYCGARIMEEGWQMNY